MSETPAPLAVSSTTKVGDLRSNPAPGWLIVVWLAYMTLAPVAWLPGVGIRPLSVVHGVLLVGAVFATFVASQNRSLPTGLAGPIGLALAIGASVFALVQTVNGTEALSRLGVTIAAFLILWAAFVWERSFGGLAAIAAWAGAIHGGLGFLILASANLGFSIVAAEGVVGSSGPDATVVGVGFGLLRTYWSGGVALFVPFVIAAVLGSHSIWVRVVMGAAVAGSFAGQVIVAGRAGLLVTLFSVVFMAAMRWGWKGLAGAFVGVAVVMVAVVTRNSRRLRFDLLFDASADGSDFTSGRMTLNEYGLERIAARPIRGEGFGVPQTDLGSGSELEIHNMWIRAGAEGGLVYLAALLAVVVNLLIAGVRGLVDVRANAGARASLPIAAAVCTLIGGVIISMFEPRFVLGHLHLTAIWWAAAGIAVAASNTANRK